MKISPTTQTHCRDFPLHLAAYNNDAARVTELLRQGYSVSSADMDGWCPLHMAAYSNALQSISLLLRQGANANASNGDGTTPLHCAAYTNAEAAISELLTDPNKAKVNPSNSTGQTPYAIAVHMDHVEAVKVLQSHQEKLGIEKDNGEGVLHICAIRNSYKVAMEYITSRDLERENKDGKTPLQLAYEYNSNRVIKILSDEIRARKTRKLFPGTPWTDFFESLRMKLKMEMIEVNDIRYNNIDEAVASTDSASAVSIKNSMVYRNGPHEARKLGFWETLPSWLIKHVIPAIVAMVPKWISIIGTGLLVLIWNGGITECRQRDGNSLSGIRYVGCGFKLIWYSDYENSKAELKYTQKAELKYTQKAELKYTQQNRKGSTKPTPGPFQQ